MSLVQAVPLENVTLALPARSERLHFHRGSALRAEDRVLRARLGPKRLRFADAERRLLAEKGKPLGRCARRGQIPASGP